MKNLLWEMGAYEYNWQIKCHSKQIPEKNSTEYKENVGYFDRNKDKQISEEEQR